jgi:flagellar protein FlgJ
MTTALSAPATTTGAATNAAVATQVKHMAGMLWYEMLSQMNANGFSDGALGTGGDDFQSMFLWNLAQNDFSKYDTQLNAAAIAQLAGGGAGAAAMAAGPAPAPAVAATDMGASALPAASSPIAAIASTIAASAGATATGATAANDATAPASGSAPAAGPVLDRAIAYAQKLWPQISAAAQQLGVPPVAILAQSALETGWGAAAAGNNFFGIKAAPGEAGTARPTHEMVNGVLQAQTASFRDYDSPAASVADYVGVIQSGFQSAMGQNSVAGFAQTLQNSGYATDQNYAAKIETISQSPMMQQVLQSVAGQTSGTVSE